MLGGSRPPPGPLPKPRPLAGSGGGPCLWNKPPRAGLAFSPAVLRFVHASLRIGPRGATLRIESRQPPKGGFLEHFPPAAAVQPGTEAVPRQPINPVQLLGCRLKSAGSTKDWVYRLSPPWSPSQMGKDSGPSVEGLGAPPALRASPAPNCGS